MTTTENAIAALVNEVSARLDVGDFAGVGELFAHGSFSVVGGPTVHGSSEVQNLHSEAIRLHADGTPRTVHVVANLVILANDEDGVAEATSRFVAFQATDRIPLQPIGAGTYHDTFTREPGGWRFASRAVRNDLVGNSTDYSKGSSRARVKGANG